MDEPWRQDCVPNEGEAYCRAKDERIDELERRLAEAEASVACQLALVEHWKAKAATQLAVASPDTARLDWLFKHGPLIAYDTDHRGELVAEWDIEDRADVDDAMARQRAEGR